MFYFKEPSSLGVPWTLSHYEEKKVVALSKDISKDLKNHHILGIDFLYQNYTKQFKGAILNEDEGLNMHLQVTAFLNAVFNRIEKKFLILIITPDDTIINWHYHLTIHGGLKVQIVKPHTCPEDFDQENGLALLLGFSNIKLAEYLIDYDYFSVVIDNFDEIASKLIVRKLCGTFNIGLSQRNFYIHPNQKLQWTMLNWSNPGCVGKLGDFYEIDNDNFANFCNNYRHWWFRLTWSFCEFFKKPTEQDKQEYLEILSKWAIDHHIKKTHVPATKARKRKNIKQSENPSQNGDGKKIKDMKSKVDKNDEEIICNKDDTKDKPQVINSQSTDDTIIYEYTDNRQEESVPRYVELPSMDENPILNSIIKNLETSPVPHKPQSVSPTSTSRNKSDRPTCSKALNDDDILLSIINDMHSSSTPIPLDHETQVSYKKEELLSQIFDEDGCASKSLSDTDGDSDFFLSLVDSDINVKVKKNRSIKRSNSDIDDILKETKILLRE